jgi:peptidoglycan-N-acetylglucosamine deacetylase
MYRYTFAALVCLTATVSAAPHPATPAPKKPATPAPAAEQAGYAVPSDAAAPTAANAPKITYSQCHVEGPYIAMTFDDGPSKEQTPRLLDMLKQRGIKATFFVCGQCVAEYPQIAKRIVDEGHEIASHSWNHPNLIPMSESAVRDQLDRTHAAVKQATGVEMKLFRPPYGNFTARQRNWAFGTYGYKTILWDVDTLDWQHRNPAKTEANALSQSRSGSIILQHDIHKTTVDAMPATLDGLAGKGFKFVTVSELIAMDKPIPPKPKATPAPADAKPDGSKTPSSTAAPATPQPQSSAPAQPAASPAATPAPKTETSGTAPAATPAPAKKK